MSRLPERGFERGDARDRTERDLERLRRRAPNRFVRQLSLIGSVGWPIVGLATGGGLLGRFLDERFHTGVRATLGLVMLGAALGAYAAWRALRGRDA